MSIFFIKGQLTHAYEVSINTNSTCYKIKTFAHTLTKKRTKLGKQDAVPFSIFGPREIRSQFHIVIKTIDRPRRSVD